MTTAIDTLKEHRAFLLAAELVGWLHMLGKAHPCFLRKQASDAFPTDSGWDDLRWARPLEPSLDERLAWVFGAGKPFEVHVADLIDKHRGQDKVVPLALLQAAHAMASGIEKNTPHRYQQQPRDQMWLVSPFGHPARNLLADPPCVLDEGAWDDLLGRIGDLVDTFRPPEGAREGAAVAHFWSWRQHAIGPGGWLVEALRSTLAETRVPSNDVTLWDQSYVAAALFKAALAGAVLAGAQDDEALKQTTRWRVLTIGFGAEHYEARAVRIGDWTGTREAIQRFFDDVCGYVEVEIALGACLYRDERVLAFTFPGLRDGTDEQAPKGSISDRVAKEEILPAIQKQVDALAASEHYRFETPPLVALSGSTRSFIDMARRIREAREALEVPVHRPWPIPPDGGGGRHVCPVTLVRPSKDLEGGKDTPSKAAYDRRTGRLASWRERGGDTIWITEVADANDRVALVTLRLGLEPWLDGSGIDGLRVHSVATWREHTPKLSGGDKTISSDDPAQAFLHHVRGYVRSPKTNKKDKLSDPVLSNFNAGFTQETELKDFFRKVVEDRADAPAWDRLDDEGRALWLAHQLLRKNASPGRVHRFWRESRAFFARVLTDLCIILRERWPAQGLRRRRLLLKASATPGALGDRQTYAGHLPSRTDAPFELLHLDELGGLLTICNLDRLFGSVERARQELAGQTVELKDDDGHPVRLTINSVEDARGPLATYDPVVVLEENPERFRLLVPLEAADACVELAVRRWREEMGRVWADLPLSASVVAFPRKTPYQAVLEAARNLEDGLEAGTREWWRIEQVERRGQVTALALLRPDGGRELRVVPTTLPDGRDDVYYPNVAVEDRALRERHDFLVPHREGRPRVYRWVPELRPGDAVRVRPARFARVFLDSTARRFEPVRPMPLADWQAARDVWRLACTVAPSKTALRNAESALAAARVRWTDLEGHLDEEAWLAFAQAILVDCWSPPPAALDALVDAARRGLPGPTLLEESLLWHLHVLKLNPDKPEEDA